MRSKAGHRFESLHFQTISRRIVGAGHLEHRAGNDPTVTGGFLAHAHTITIEVLGIRTEALVYFAAEEHFRRNVLGRTGWLDRVKLGLIDYEGKLLLSALVENA